MRSLAYLAMGLLIGWSAVGWTKSPGRTVDGAEAATVRGAIPVGVCYEYGAGTNDFCTDVEGCTKDDVRATSITTAQEGGSKRKNVPCGNEPACTFPVLSTEECTLEEPSDEVAIGLLAMTGRPVN